MMKEISAHEFEMLSNTNKTFVLHFWAEWNGYDVEQKKYFESLEHKFSNVPIYQKNVDVKENSDLCKLHNVMGPPTIAFYKKGQLIERVVGVIKEQILAEKLRALSTA